MTRARPPAHATEAAAVTPGPFTGGRGERIPATMKGGRFYRNAPA